MDGSGRGRAAGAAGRHCAAALLHISGGAQSLGRSPRLCPGPCLQPLLHAHARAQPQTPCGCWRSTDGHKGSGGLGSVEMVTGGCMHWIRRRPGRLLTCCAGRQRTHWRGGQERMPFTTVLGCDDFRTIEAVTRGIAFVAPGGGPPGAGHGAGGGGQLRGDGGALRGHRQRGFVRPHHGPAEAPVTIQRAGRLLAPQPTRTVIMPVIQQAGPEPSRRRTSDRLCIIYIN